MVQERYSIEELKEVIIPIAEKYHISKVYLFGSFARGDYNEQSDIDLRIEKGELKGMFALCGFYSEVEEALQMKVDVVTTGSLDEEFLKAIKEEEVTLYAG
ncbi:MAG: nucleotidyltransferase [Firmicutes bacterium HGW-Firmicutes-7]|nr:MAG: nucleotidyltransferase [Firmicutes bacterium HGW-Firmicutes-7]